MKCLQIDENNNLVIKQNQLTLVSDIQACAQSVKTRIGLYKGEDPQDLDRGIDFDNVVLGSNISRDYVKDLIRQRILDTDDGIENISLLTIEKKENKLEIQAEIQSTYGVIRL